MTDGEIEPPRAGQCAAVRGRFFSSCPKSSNDARARPLATLALTDGCRLDRSDLPDARRGARCARRRANSPALELTQAHLDAMASAPRAQRLYRRDAGQGAGDGAGERRAPRQRARRVRSKACRSASRTFTPPAASIRRRAAIFSTGFKPPYESTVTAHLVARRRGDARQAQHGRVRHGLVERDVLLRTRRLAVAAAQLEREQGARRARRRQARPAGARRLVGRLGGGGGGAALSRRDRERHRRLDPPAGGVHRHRSASSRLTAAARARASSPSPRRSTRPGRSPARCATARSCCARWRGTIPRIRPASTRRCPTTKRRSARSIKGMKIGVPKEYRLDGMNRRDRKALGARRRLAARGGRRASSTFRCRNTRHALPAYYIVAPAEASSQSRPL